MGGGQGLQAHGCLLAAACSTPGTGWLATPSGRQGWTAANQGEGMKDGRAAGIWEAMHAWCAPPPACYAPSSTTSKSAGAAKQGGASRSASRRPAATAAQAAAAGRMLRAPPLLLLLCLSAHLCAILDSLYQPRRVFKWLGGRPPAATPASPAAAAATAVGGDAGDGGGARWPQRAPSPRRPFRVCRGRSGARPALAKSAVYEGLTARSKRQRAVRTRQLPGVKDARAGSMGCPPN